MDRALDARSEPTARRRWLELAAWIALWCVARGALVLVFADVFFYGEELEKACAAKAMLDGLPLAHHELAFHAYEGGGFVVSHLDALAFAVLGQNLLAVKLVALALGAAVLAAGWKLCERAGGLAAARAFALLFVLAPASVQKNSLLALGIHFHALLFVALILACTLRIVVDGDVRPRTWLAWGLSSGFGFFFSYQCALTIVVAAGAIVWARRREVLTRGSAWAALGTAIGICPLLWMAAHVGGEVFDIHGAELVGGKQTKLDTLSQFFGSLFAGRGALDLFALATLAAAPWLVVAALRRGAPRTLRAGAWLVVAHAALFVAAYLASGFTVGRVVHYFWLHRLAPLWFFAVAALALGFAAAQRSPRGALRAVAWIALLASAGFGVLDTIREVRGAAPWELGARVGKLRASKGYDYPHYLQKLFSHVEGSTAEKLALALRFREEDPALLHEAIAVALYGDGKTSLEAMRAEVRGAGVSDDSDFVRGYGNALRSQLNGDLAMRAAAVQGEAPPVRDLLLEAIGRAGNTLIATQDRLRREVQQARDAQLPAAVFLGLGSRLHEARGDLSLRYWEMKQGPLSLDRRRAYAWFDEYPHEVSVELMHGYDAAHLRHWLDGFKRP